MRGAKGVVDIDVAQGGHLARQGLLVFFLSRVDAAVFQQHDLSGSHVHSLHPVTQQGDRLAQQFTQALGHGLQ